MMGQRIDRTVGVLAVVVSCALASLAMPHVASATDAAAINAELAAAGVPNVAVTVTTPAPATQQDLDAFDADPSGSYASLTPENLISPDPTAPLPVAQVTFGPSTVTRWPGFVQAPGIDAWYALEDSEVPVWRLDIMEALKHRLGAGSTLAGVAMRPTLINRSDPTQPDMYITPPDPADFPPAPLPQTMPTALVEEIVAAGLPPTAIDATVKVVDFAGGQRRLAISVTRVAELSLLDPLAELVAYALSQQSGLNAEGANIGSVVIRALDATRATPLATYAGDVSWGQSFSWVSPSLMAYEMPMTPAAPVDAVSDVEGKVAQLTTPPDE